MFDEFIGRMMKCFVKYFQFLTLIFFRLLTLVYDNIKMNALIHDFFIFYYKMIISQETMQCFS